MITQFVGVISLALGQTVQLGGTPSPCAQKYEFYLTVCTFIF
jgi:hypothetical protein